MSPILVADGEFDAARVTAEFTRRALQLDGTLREFILARIAEAVNAGGQLKKLTLHLPLPDHAH